jgi:hypothetical protein
MTEGTLLAGDNANLISCRFRYKKYWAGADGRYETDRVSRKPKWNNYSMANLHFKSESSALGLINKTTGEYSVVDNSVMSGPENYVVGWGFPTSLFDTYWDSRKETKLLAKLLRKSKGHQFNMGVALAEVDKLAGTIAGTIKNLAYGVVDLSRLRFDRFARRFGTSPPSAKRVKKLQFLDISGRFLEMRYAWAPAIDDAFEACMAFESLSNGPRQQVFKASDFKEVSYSAPGNYRKDETKLLFRRTYTYEMYEEMEAYRQMGLANPLSILWERLPWSFVLDWFLPVGNYLELIGQVPFMKGRFMRTDTVEFKSFLLPELNDSTAMYNKIAQPIPSVGMTAFYMQRGVSSEPPVVPTPDLKVAGAVQGKRLQNALALAHQVFFKAERNQFINYY